MRGNGVAIARGEAAGHNAPMATKYGNCNSKVSTVVTGTLPDGSKVEIGIAVPLIEAVSNLGHRREMGGRAVFVDRDGNELRQLQAGQVVLTDGRIAQL